ncbi:MAG TPA: ABC transporter permease [Chloroflexota bacterium]|nr:ABC transporter permease [Chloroflexota bacterium]
MIESIPLMHVSRGSQARAVLAVARKDWLHFVRYPLNAVFRVLQPLMFLTPIYFLGKSFASGGGNSAFAGYAGTSDFMSFVLVGALLSSYVSAVFWGMGYALKTEMDTGVLESNWMLPVPRTLFLVGQTVASLAITTLTGAVLLALSWLLFGFRIDGNLLPAVAVLAPLLVSLYGFGFAFAGLVLLLRDANTLVDVADFTVSLLSGSQFPVEVLPRLLLPLALALPTTYGYDAVRGLLLGTRTLLPIPTEFGILLTSMVLLVTLGVIAFRLVERYCRMRGTLGTH